MPQVFELARESGVDREKLFLWAIIHKDLLREAFEIAKSQDHLVHLEDGKELDVGCRVYRGPIQIPADLRRWVNPHPV